MDGGWIGATVSEIVRKKKKACTYLFSRRLGPCGIRHRSLRLSKSIHRGGCGCGARHPFRCGSFSFSFLSCQIAGRTCLLVAWRGIGQSLMIKR